jgi:outer membrane protein TolC
LSILIPIAASPGRVAAQEPPPQETAPQETRPQEATTPERPTVELGLQDAVSRALENNLDIAVEKFNPDASGQNVKQLEGYYQPVLFSTISQTSQTDPARNVFAGAEKVDTDTLTYDFGASHPLPTGGNLRVDFNNTRTNTNSVFSTFNPSFSSLFNASLTQPLLRNLKIDDTRLQIRVARKNREISDAQFRQTVVNTVASVKQLYYDLIYAIDNFEAQKKSLALAKKLLEENQIRVRVGTMAPLDVVAAESEVAGRDEGVILAENALLEAEDLLRRAIFSKNDPDTWALRIVPKDRPSAEQSAVDLATAMTTALEKRTDIVAARKNVESAELNVDFARNQRLPRVDLVAGYGTSGVGGTLIERDGLGGPIVRTIPGGYGDALSDVFGAEFPTWSLGVNVSYPILNKQANAAAARARILKDQAVASLHRLEMQVAAEVRSAARAVDTNFKRVQSTQAARVLQERRLDAEEKKFAAGMSTNFQVTQSQRDLALAEVAELRAIADYRKSLVNFERVQEAGGGGVSFASSSSVRSGQSSNPTTAQSSTGTTTQP